MLYVVNYADGEPFESYRRLNTKTAKWIGKADKVFEYSSKDIPESFKSEHKEIFEYKRGAGLWLWKPYIILDSLNKISNNDWLFYCDAACYFVSSIKPLIKFANNNNQDLLLFGLPLINRQFCKKECYVKMGVEDSGENQTLATYLLIKKTDTSVSFIKEWLFYCCQHDMISPNHINLDIEEFPDFFSHREDQSILSLLRIKYKLPHYEECSNYRIFPYIYCYEEFEYKPLKENLTPYGVILINNRASNPYLYLYEYCKMYILKYLGLKYTEKDYIENKRSFSINEK